MESAMRTKALVPVIGLVILAGTIAACGATSSASAKNSRPSAKTSTTRVAGGRGASKAGGVVQLTAYQDNDGPNSRVVLTGAIGDYGKAVRTYANGTTVQQYNRLDVGVTRGSFQLKIAGLEQSLVNGASQLPTDLGTCSGTEIVTATTPIVAGSGTGEYQGISGAFKMTVTINEVDSWSRCPRSGQTLITESVFSTGSGVVSFS
jgi:hypothetical protein